MAPASPILALPLHVVCSVLKKLPNAKSLLAAISSHSVFYRSLKEYEDIIASAVICTEISSPFYAYAMAAYAIRSQPRLDYEHICNILYDLQFRILCFPSRGKVGFRCRPDLRAASYISTLHEAVKHFIARIGEEAIPRGVYDLGLERTERRDAVSESEEFIIGRALYRFQIFSELVMVCYDARDAATDKLPTGIFTKAFVTEVWLGPFPPWVNEQLATIYDYLLYFTNAKFDRVAKHDVEWGARRVDCFSKYDDNPYTKGLVMYGLRFLQRLDTTSQYDDVRKILQDKGMPYSTSGLNDYLEHCIDWTIFGLRTATNTGQFTDKGLRRMARQLRYRTWKLYCKRMDAKFSDPKNHSKGSKSTEGSDASCSGERVHLQHEDLDDSPHFPCQAWRIAHHRKDIRHSVHRKDMRLIRLGGYVLWDEPESDFHLFELMGHLIRGIAVVDRTMASERRHIDARRQATWAARLDIYKQGGRGFWSDDGINVIEWTEENIDDDGIEKLRRDRRDMTIPKETKEERGDEHNT